MGAKQEVRPPVGSQPKLVDNLEVLTQQLWQVGIVKVHYAPGQGVAGAAGPSGEVLADALREFGYDPA